VLLLIYFQVIICKHNVKETVCPYSKSYCIRSCRLITLSYIDPNLEPGVLILKITLQFTIQESVSVLPFLHNKFYRRKLCISHLSPASGRKTEGDTLRGGQLTCSCDRAGDLGLRPFFRANSSYIIKYGVRMQLRSFQALRVLVHFPFFYVWEVKHASTYDM
jgi:hypothetical protein